MIAGRIVLGVSPANDRIRSDTRQSGVLGLRFSASPAVQALASWRITIVTAAALVIVALILEQFWYYWRTLI